MYDENSFDINWQINVYILIHFVYRANLGMVIELGDQVAQGHACGNLGNTYYLLGNFTVAIKYHSEVSICRLAL